MRFQDTLGISHFIRMLDLELEAAIGRELQKHGISHAQYTALSALEQAPGLSNAELARECFVTPQTMNRMVQGMEKEGLITRKEREDASPRIGLTLTKRAKALVCDAHVLVHEIELKMTRGMARPRIEETKALLLRWKQNIQVEE